MGIGFMCDVLQGIGKASGFHVLCQLMANAGKDCFQHLRFQTSGLGIIAAAMIAIVQCEAIWQSVRCAVGK